MMLQTEPVPVRLEGARGPLTQAQSQKILADLRKKSPDTGPLEHHIAIEEALAGNPLTVGNKVTLLQDGQATYPAMLAVIRSAKHHVHMETYIFDEDEAGRTFAAALLERAKAGVKVRLIYDAIGSNKTPREFFERMAAGGVEVREFNPASPDRLLLLNQRDHRKLTLVDGHVAFVGGINISGVYLRSRSGSTSGSSGGSHGAADAKQDPFDQQPWRDTQVRIEGPVVADLQEAFLKQWARLKNEPVITDKAYYPPLKPAGTELVRAIAGSPSSETGVNAAYVALILAIDNAERSVHITNAYFVPHPELVKALERAARRGVDVKLVLPGRTDSWLAFNAGRSFYEDLLEDGVKIFERKTRLLHSKTATIDGVWSTVGSTNLDWRSLVYNDELNAVIIGPEFARQMETLFGRDLADSTEITHEAWRDRPLQSRIRELAARMTAQGL